MYTPIQFAMIENIIAYGISTMFFQIKQINNMVQLLKIIKNKNSPTNPLKQIEYLCWVIQFGHQWSQPQFKWGMFFYYGLLAYRDCTMALVDALPLRLISKPSCSWSTFFTAQLDIRIQDREIRLIPIYTVQNHAKSRCIASNLFFQIVAAVDISHCRDALIFTHGNDM